MLGGLVRPTPLPGDAEALAQDAATYTATADAIDDAIARIRALATDAFRSDAIDALQAAQDGVGEDVRRAYARYRAVGDALTDYAQQLRAAQDDADTAIRAWDDAHGRLQQLQYPLQDAQQRAAVPGPDQPFAAGDLARLTADSDGAFAQMQSADAFWQQAAAAKDLAARHAASRIEGGNDAGDLDDSIWDDLGDIVDVLNVVNAFVRQVLKIVSLIMTILAIVFAIASIFFQPFAAVAAALFGYAQLVNLAIALLALLQFLMDGFHLMDLVVVGVAVVAAFGGAVVGKVLGAATNAAVSGAVSGFGEAASKAAGAAASQAVTAGVKEVTDEAVSEVLDLGSDDARALYDDLGPAAGGFLSTQFSGGVDAATAKAGEIGGWVGDDFRAGIAETGLPDLAQGGIAAVGHVLAPVYDQAAAVANQVDTAIKGAQHSADAALGAVADRVSSVTDQGRQVGSDLGRVFGDADGGGQVSDFLSGLGKDALGRIPGGDLVSQLGAGTVGDLAQSMQSAASKGGLPVLAGASR